MALAQRRPAACDSQALLLPFVEGTPLDHFVADAPTPSQWSHDYRALRLRLATVVGRQLGCLLADGVINRDHKLSNLIMDDQCRDESLEPVIIDPLGLRRWRRRSPGR